jgi:hypothetical protein
MITFGRRGEVDDPVAACRALPKQLGELGWILWRSLSVRCAIHGSAERCRDAHHLCAIACMQEVRTHIVDTLVEGAVGFRLSHCEHPYHGVASKAWCWFRPDV